MKLLKNIHPGEIILEEFLIPLGISQFQLAKDTGISYSSVMRIIKGEQAITVETAVKLSAYFGMSEEFWLNIQNSYDLEELRRKKMVLFSKTKRKTPRVRRLKVSRIKRPQKLKVLS